MAEITSRRDRRAPARGAQPRALDPTMTCAIKGNINRKGDKIYHVPGSHDYTRVVIDEKAGERMFCTEAEAQSAGWRAPL